MSYLTYSSHRRVYPAQVISLGEENQPPFLFFFFFFFTNLPLSLSLFRFFEDLERRHCDNPVIRDISDIVQNHGAHHFEPYIVYCSNETFQQRTLQKLLWVAEQTGDMLLSLCSNTRRDRLNFPPSFVSPRTSNTAFKEALNQIEGSSECGGLPMISFLILPMQRVTRLPLLLDVSLTFTLLHAQLSNLIVKQRLFPSRSMPVE